MDTFFCPIMSRLEGFHCIKHTLYIMSVMMRVCLSVVSSNSKTTCGHYRSCESRWPPPRWVSLTLAWLRWRDSCGEPCSLTECRPSCPPVTRTWLGREGGLWMGRLMIWVCLLTLYLSLLPSSLSVSLSFPPPLTISHYSSPSLSPSPFLLSLPHSLPFLLSLPHPLPYLLSLVQHFLWSLFHFLISPLIKF